MPLNQRHTTDLMTDASDAILERWKDAEEPSESEKLEATDEPSEEETDEEVIRNKMMMMTMKK